MKFTEAELRAECGDCDDDGMDTHGKPCTHDYLRERLADAVERPRRFVPRGRWTDCYGERHGSEL